MPGLTQDIKAKVWIKRGTGIPEIADKWISVEIARFAPSECSLLAQSDLPGCAWLVSPVLNRTELERLI
jgi:hypothetical protein